MSFLIFDNFYSICLISLVFYIYQLSLICGENDCFSFHKLSMLHYCKKHFVM